MLRKEVKFSTERFVEFNKKIRNYIEIFDDCEYNQSKDALDSPYGKEATLYIVF